MTKNTQKMTPQDLKAAHRELGLNRTEMANQLRISRSGYVKLERGERPISGLCEVAVELLLKHDRLVMQAITEKISDPRSTLGSKKMEKC